MSIRVKMIPIHLIKEVDDAAIILAEAEKDKENIISHEAAKPRRKQEHILTRGAIAS